MKKLMLVIFGAIAFCGCDEIQKEDSRMVFAHKIYDVDIGEGISCPSIYQVDIDGHEYLLLYGIYRGGICHSATCRFCSKKRKKLKNEEVPIKDLVQSVSAEEIIRLDW